MKTFFLIISCSLLSLVTSAMAHASVHEENGFLTSGSSINHYYAKNSIAAISADHAPKQLNASIALALKPASQHNGYVINRFVRVEGGFKKLANIDVIDGGSYQGTKRIDVAYGDVKASYPIFHAISVYTRAGYAAMIERFENDVQSTDTTANSETHLDYDPMASAGFEFHVLPHLGLNMQYTAFINPHEDPTKGMPTTTLATGGIDIDL